MRFDRACEARQCLLPYCRDDALSLAQMRLKLAADKAADLAAWKRSKK